MKFRRQCLCIFLALLLALPFIAALGEGEVVLVNALSKGEAGMTCVFLSRISADKSDAMLILAQSEAGLEVFLIDGGQATTAAYQALIALRRDILRQAGMEEQHTNHDYKLELTLLPTHFHSDHVNELINYILPSKLFAVKAMVYPPATQLLQDGTYDNTQNADRTKRVSVLNGLAQHHPQAELTELAYGETRVLPTSIGEIKLFAPSEDWGSPQNAAYAAELYYNNAPRQVKTELPTVVINANCMWIRAQHQGASVLFTGDAMKKIVGADESFDRMIAYYGDALRANVVKYPHHGLSRDPACQPLLDHLLIPGEDARVVLTGQKGHIQAGIALTKAGAPWVDIEKGSVSFALTQDGAVMTIGE